METFAALTIAVVGTGLPTAAYVGLVWWLDRYEKEPVWLLALAFAWGAVPAAILSLLLEMAIDLPIYSVGGDSLAAQLLSYGVGAPIVEESVKGIALVALVLLFPQEFDSLLDGIIYGAMIGLGFSMTETSVAYTLPILLESGLGPGLINLLWRAVFFGLNHAFWTAVTGTGMAYARLAARPASWIVSPAAAWGLAILLHGLHNVGAILTEPAFCLPLSLSLIVDWGGLLTLGILAVLILRRERIWIVQGLTDEVSQGILSQPELDLLSSATRRGIVRWQALARGGLHAFWAIGRYSQIATELAFRKRRLPGPHDPARLQHLNQLRLTLGERRAEALPWLDISTE